jgi:hypothetical protein
MRDRRPRARVSQGVNVPAAACAIAAAAVLLAITAAGCGSPSSSNAAVSCGTARTAANVPVHIQVVRGQVSCATAMQVERDYAADILAGKVPGTGGGAPVHVQGWTCQGFSTPVVLKTGQTSKCVDGGSEILASLPSPA